jgi:hypothetical protein
MSGAMPLFGLLVVGLGCGRSLAAQPPSETDWGTFKWERSTGMTSGLVAGPADSVFAVLPVFLKELGIELKEVDRAGGKLAVRRYRVVRKLGKDRVSASLTCGDGMTGPNADNYHVFLTAAIELAARPAGQTSFVMYLGAEAINVPGGTNERVTCATTGTLEYRLVERLRQRFPPGAG